MARQQQSYFNDNKLVKSIEDFRSALGAPALSNFFKLEMDLAQDGPEPVDSFPVALDAASSGVYQKEKVANDIKDTNGEVLIGAGFDITEEILEKLKD